MTARGEGAGDALQLVDDPAIAGTPVLAGQSGRPAVDGAMCSPPGTDSIAGRSATGGAAATTLRRAAEDLGSADRRRARLADRPGRRQFRPHVGQRRDLLRPVRQRRGSATPRRPPARRTGGIWRLFCDRARPMTRPILTAEQMRAAEAAAIAAGTAETALMERAGRGAGRGGAALCRPARHADPVRAGQ